MNDAAKTTKAWGDDPKNALEVWKYYGSIAGADKDTMIKIVTWLLGVSTGIIGLYANAKGDGQLTNLLLVLGVLVSGLAAFISLLYGAYAAWNWSIADQIAESYGFKEQKPKDPPFSDPIAFPLCLAKPCGGKIAYVFKVFFLACMLSLLAHAILLCLRLCK
jgi:hypothetical protein